MWCNYFDLAARSHHKLPYKLIAVSPVQMWACISLIDSAC